MTQEVQRKKKRLVIVGSPSKDPVAKAMIEEIEKKGLSVEYMEPTIVVYSGNRSKIIAMDEMTKLGAAIVMSVPQIPKENKKDWWNGFNRSNAIKKNKKQNNKKNWKKGFKC